MAAAYETFAIERRPDGVAIVRMNRPEKLNAMNPAFFRELPAVLAELDADDEVDVCVLTGAGRAFSAGGDIASFQDLTDVPAYRRHLRLVYDAFHAVERAQVPVIAAVNGIAYGGGTEQALRIGLVQSVVDDADLLDEALAVGGRIRSNAPLAVRAAKQFINRDTGGSGMAESIEATALLFTTDDHKARAASFVGGERRL
jgi:enoyl-CoA hydratase